MNLLPRIGSFDVQAVLSQGPGGTVYQALDTATKRQAAIRMIQKKHVSAARLADTLTRARREAQAAASLNNPRIAALYDYLENDAIVCVVTELVHGKTLTDHIEAVTQCGFQQAWNLLRQALDALEHAHGKGVVHADLKPANVLIGADGRVKIVGFGAASLSAVTGDPSACAPYLAPEQFESGTASALSDLYQIGVITYEMLTGARPFAGSPEEIKLRVTLERPVGPSTLNPQISWHLDWTIQKALSKDPRDRFQNPREFAQALKQGLEESHGGPLAAATPAAPAKPVAAAAPASARAAPSPAPASLADKARLIAGAREAGVMPALVSSTSATFATGAEAKKARVLFVDDDERILNALRILFRDHYHVFTAENGALALEFVKRFGIHVVVSDQRMPGMTGVELLRQVREASPSSVRMLLTGYSDLAATVDSINEGEVFRFVKKPWDNAEIKRTLEDAVAIALELGAAAAAAEASLPHPESTVLVIDPDATLSEGLKQLLAGISPLRHVTSPVEAVRVLESEEVAVIVADLAAGKDGLVTLFKLLKSERPEILTVLVTDAPDSELVIELINQAQIYRFLGKPINARELRTHVDSALRKYAGFKQSPGLAARHKVPPNGQAATSDWGVKLVDRIRGLPKRLQKTA